MDLKDIHILFKPLSQEEKKSLPLDILTLLDTVAFQKVVRHLFHNTNPLATIHTFRENSTSLDAAFRDGERNFPRELLNIILNQNAPIVEKPKKVENKFKL